MTIFPQDAFEDAADPEIVNKLSDFELAILSVLERHGEISDADVEQLSQSLDQHCAELVINAMFSEQPTYAQFFAREEEFNEACRQKIKEYGEGKFDLPPAPRGIEVKVNPTAP